MTVRTPFRRHENGDSPSGGRAEPSTATHRRRPRDLPAGRAAARHRLAWPTVVELRADCSRCVGLCCVAPAFARSADFAVDKPAGTPCTNLPGGLPVRHPRRPARSRLRRVHGVRLPRRGPARHGRLRRDGTGARPRSPRRCSRRSGWRGRCTSCSGTSTRPASARPIRRWTRSGRASSTPTSPHATSTPPASGSASCCASASERLRAQADPEHDMSQGTTAVPTGTARRPLTAAKRKTRRHGNGDSPSRERGLAVTERETRRAGGRPTAGRTSSGCAGATPTCAGPRCAARCCSAPTCAARTCGWPTSSGPTSAAPTCAEPISRRACSSRPCRPRPPAATPPPGSPPRVPRPAHWPGRDRP